MVGVLWDDGVDDLWGVVGADLDFGAVEVSFGLGFEVFGLSGTPMRKLRRGCCPSCCNNTEKNSISLKSIRNRE